MSGADKEKQNLEEGAGTDKNKEKEAGPSSRRTPTRYSAANKGKQKTEEGTGADKNQEKEDEPSSGGEPTRYSAADKGKQKTEEGTGTDKNQEKEYEPIFSGGGPMRYLAVDDKGKLTIVEGTEAAKLRAERYALLERAELDRKKVADERIQQIDAACYARSTRYRYWGAGFQEIEPFFSTDDYSHLDQDWYKKCVMIVLVMLAVFTFIACVVVYMLHKPR